MPATEVRETSKAAQNRVTTPGADAVIAEVTNLKGGFYKVNVAVGFGATAEATTPNNMRVKQGATVIAPLYFKPVIDADPTPYELYIDVPQGGNISVSTNAAGSAGSIYQAMVIATRIG